MTEPHEKTTADAFPPNDFSDLSIDDLWALYKETLKTHDWYFEGNMEAPKGYVQNGRQERGKIADLYELLAEEDWERASDMYHKACPWLGVGNAGSEVVE